MLQGHSNMELKYDRRSQKDRRKNNQSESFPLQDGDGKTIEKNRRLKGDRRTEGLELSVADMPDEEFSKYFDQFDKEDTLIAAKNTIDPSEKWEINDYQVLHREGAEFAYLTIVYTDQEDQDTPDLYAFRGDSDNSESDQSNKPTQVQCIHDTDVYKYYVDNGWNDITKTEEVLPWVIKSWLAQHMKQDTI